MKTLGKALALVLCCVLLLAGLGIGYLSLREYQPASVEPAEISGGGDAVRRLQEGQSLKLLSWNIGYAALGAEQDFFMDGGTLVRPKDAQTVGTYLNNIWNTVHLKPGTEEYDLVMFQEVDEDSRRSYGVNQRSILSAAETCAFAPNYVCDFVPFPMPPLGRVHSGLLTDAGDYEIRRAERIALPCPFSWPMRVANLKRCLLVSYLPIEGSDKELVLVNLHLEAYDDGEGKIAQTRQLCSFLESEYEKGNYVIAGGDFNQVFPDTTSRYPITTAELWEPGVLSPGDLPGGFQLVWDEETPTCRLLNAPYDPESTQHYVIDGFILSPNVTLESVETLDLGFENSDHNPVEIHVTLG